MTGGDVQVGLNLLVAIVLLRWAFQALDDGYFGIALLQFVLVFVNLCFFVAHIA